MHIKIYLYFILILWYQVFANKTDEYTDAEKNEIELYRQLFLRLNTIIKSNTKVEGEILDIKEELKKLTEKNVSVPATLTLSNNSPSVPQLCSYPDSPVDNNDVYCFGNNWTVILRRNDGSENFDRNWNDYKNGFGEATHEYFIGLEKLYALTLMKPHELLIILEDFDNNRHYAKYDYFKIGSEAQQYRLLELGQYKGNAGDSLRYHVGAGFSTVDRDNDEHNDLNCAKKFGGGWWFKACHHSNLNGHYIHSEHDRSYASGIHWRSFRAHWYSLKYAQMMVRPKN